MNLRIENLLDQDVAVCSRSVLPGGLVLKPKATVVLSVNTAVSPRFVPALEKLVAAGWLKFAETDMPVAAPVTPPEPPAPMVAPPAVTEIETATATEDGKQFDKKNKKKD